LTEALNHKDIMEALFDKMAITHLDELPFLFPFDSETLFDNIDTWMIPNFLKFMIAKDLRGVFYNEIIYKNKKRLISLGIDLKIYFESPLFRHLITDFPDYHCDETEHFVPAHLLSLT
jgi:hypothetical protein